MRGLDVEQVPELEPEDLFAAFAEPLAPEALLTPAGYLRPDAVAGTWQHTPQRLATWARAVYECGNAVVAELAARGPQALATAISESSAALLCLELERDGLPVDRATMAGLIAQAAGERPRDAAHGILLRAERDQAVLRHAPGHERTDLRNRDYYWMGFRHEMSQPAEGTDLRAIYDGKISVTPLHIDLTHAETVHRLKGVLGGAPPKA